MKRAMLIAAAVAATFATPATAGVLTDSEDPFDGPYIGGQVGFSSFDLENAGGPGSNVNMDGFVYSGVLGWRKHTEGGYLLGIEGTLGAYNSDATLTTNVGPAQFEGDMFWGVDGVFGHSIGEKVLAFVSVGYRNGFFNGSLLGVPGSQTDADLDGARFGGGFEWSFSPVLNIRVGGGYTDYSEEQAAPAIGPVEVDGFDAQAGFVINL